VICYLSGPISNGGTATLEERTANVEASYDPHLYLTQHGVSVINPMLTHFVDPTGVLDHATWLSSDYEIIAKCDCLLRLPGESSGADAEVEFAQRKGIPVYYSVDSVLLANEPVEKVSALTEAMEVAGQSRSRDYGHPLENHQRIANLWNAYMEGRNDPSSPLEAEEVAWMMVLLKVAREQHTHKHDSLVDVCGYVRCIELMHEKRAEKLQ